MNKITYHKILVNNLIAFENISFIVQNKQGALTLCLYSTLLESQLGKEVKGYLSTQNFKSNITSAGGGKIVYVENSKFYSNC